MWPYTKEENDWLDQEPSHDPVPPDKLNYYIQEAQRLRSEALGRMLANLWSAIGRLFRRQRADGHLPDSAFGTGAKG